MPGVMGSGDAPVLMVEFSDYQCGYCGRYVAETLPEIIKNYVDTGQVRYIVRDLPLSYHDKAQKAAEAARCAGAQGAYWEMHDRLFDAQGEWSGRKMETALAKFAGYAEDLGLDMDAFEACLQSGEFAIAVDEDAQLAEQWGVRSTPSFLINGQLVVGAFPYEHFAEIIEGALADQR